MSPLVKKLSWALACSLALNLFFLGFGVARRLSQPHHHDGALAGEPPGPHSKLRRRWFGQHAPRLKAQHREVALARKQVADALTAEPFEPAALERALADLRATTAAGQQRMHEALLESAKRLTREERRELAESRLLRDVGPPHPRHPH